MSDAPSRRDDNRSKIVEVAARLLQQHGAAAVTTRGVAEAAGLQAPTIYRLFGDKDGLLDAVAEHVMATHVSAKAAQVHRAAAENLDPIADLRAGWDLQIEFGVANPSLFRLLSNPERVLRSPAAQAGRRILETRVHRIAEIGRLRVSEQRAVDLIHSAGTGVIHILLAAPADVRDPELATSMFEAVSAQILTDGPAPSDNPALATTIAFRTLAPKLELLSGAERALLGEWLDRAVEDLASRSNTKSPAAEAK